MFDIAIIGYGPTGGVLANLLGQAGLRTVVIERETEVLQQPRAAHFDGEVMRIFQSVGLAEPIMAIARPGTQGMHFINAQGDVLMIRQGSDRPGPHGYTNNWYFHQPDLEQVLRDGATRFDNVQLRLGCELVGVQQRADQVELSLVQRDGARMQLHARYVVGCDGARSIMRKLMGARIEDLGLHQPWLCIDLRMQRDVGLPAYSVQLCDPRRPITMVNMAGDRRRWEIMLMPGDDPATVATEDNVWKLLAPWVKPTDAQIERSAVYTFHSVIARAWRNDRMLIAGDAAHQTPPFLGQGMCAGIRDAANLWWKLDLVCRGAATDSILDSYESERAPHVRTFIELAVRLGAVIQTTDVQAAAARDRRFKTEGTQVFAFPSPRLGPGLNAGAQPPAGTIFPQIDLGGHLRLDDEIGPRFALLASSALRDAATSAVRSFDAASIALIESRSEALERWLGDTGVGAVLLRPDRYVFDVARSAEDIPGLLAKLSLVQNR